MNATPRCPPRVDRPWCRFCGLLLMVATAFADGAVDESAAPPAPASASALGALPLWDDGFSEICFYDATTSIYGQPRAYTRVHLVNREWFDPQVQVKSAKALHGALPVLKLNVAEEIPTENYNYRFLTTLIVERASLAPRKLTVGSQEWCGNTYKHLIWDARGLLIRSFSYFESEGEQTAELPAEVWPFEASFLLAREVVARGDLPALATMLTSQRHTRAARTTPFPARFALGPSQRVSVPAGSFETREVELTLGDQVHKFVVELAPPHRLLRYTGPDGEFSLKGCEHRAYWDRNWRSAFHPRHRAP